MKSVKRILQIIIIMFVVAALGILAINFYVIQTTKDNIISMEEAQGKKDDCIIVLGAAVKADASPSAMLKDRLDMAVNIFEDGATDILLMSGDNGQIEYNEVAAMKSYAISEGVSENNVYLDYAGFSTYESMYRLRDVFEADSAIVVTQKYHLYRALYVGEKLGLDVIGVAAEEKDYSGQFVRDIREVFARVKDFFYVIVDKQPTYLGDTIELKVKDEV